MRLFLFLMLMFFPFAAAGQKLNGPASLAEGESSEFYYDVDDQYRYLAYEFAVPAGSIGFIGLRRLSGDADADMRVGTSIAAGTFDRAQVDGILASNTEDDVLPSLMVFATEGLAAQTVYAEFWIVDNNSGVWKVGYETFNIGAELIAAATAAAIETIVVCSLIDCTPSRTSSPKISIERSISACRSSAATTSAPSPRTSSFVKSWWLSRKRLAVVAS